jgi:IS605 OrfB family transposase
MAADAALGAYAKLFGEVERHLFAAIAAGGDAEKLKPEFCRQHGITARQYNAIYVQLRGRIDSIKGRRRGLIEEQTRRIEKARKVVKELSRPPKVKRGTPPETPADRKAREAKLHQKTRRLAALEPKLASQKADEVNGVIRIAFGSRDLFHAQFDLLANGYGNHQQWQQDWRAARSRQIFVLGSKDETAGCQGCVATVNEDESLDLRVRLPDALIGDASIEKQEGKYVILRGLRFSYGHENVLKALQASRWVREGERSTRTGVALSWRFLREVKDGKPLWYVHVSVDVTPPAIVTRRQAGAVGVDFNADHLAVAEVDRFRNVIDHERINTYLDYKSSEQREAILGDAVKQVVARAVAAGKPVVVEKLDFSAKKAQLEDLSPRRARALSALAYGQFDRLLKGACFRAGVEVIEVNPAYTSVIGAINHAQLRGISIHLGAACAIARRGLEKTSNQAEAPRASVMRDGALVPTRNGDHVTLPVPARIRGKHVWTQWAGAKRRLCATLEEYDRCGKGNLDPPPLSQLRAPGAVPASRATGRPG